MDKVDAFLAQNIIKQSVLYKNIATKVKQGDYDILFYFSNIEKLEVFLLMQNLIKDASQKVFLFRQAWTMAECNYMYKKVFPRIQRHDNDRKRKRLFRELAE